MPKYKSEWTTVCEAWETGKGPTTEKSLKTWTTAVDEDTDNVLRRLKDLAKRTGNPDAAHNFQYAATEAKVKAKRSLDADEARIRAEGLVETFARNHINNTYRRMLPQGRIPIGMNLRALEHDTLMKWKERKEELKNVI